MADEADSIGDEGRMCALGGSGVEAFTFPFDTFVGEARRADFVGDVERLDFMDDAD